MIGDDKKELMDLLDGYGLATDGEARDQKQYTPQETAKLVTLFFIVAAVIGFILI